MAQPLDLSSEEKKRTYLVRFQHLVGTGCHRWACRWPPLLHPRASLCNSPPYLPRRVQPGQTSLTQDQSPPHIWVNYSNRQERGGARRATWEEWRAWRAVVADQAVVLDRAKRVICSRIWFQRNGGVVGTQVMTRVSISRRVPRNLMKSQ